MKLLKLKEFYFGKLDFNPELRVRVLTTDIVRQIGKYLNIDFNEIPVDQLFYGIKIEQKNHFKDIKTGTPNQMKNLILFAKIAINNIRKDDEYYDKLMGTNGITNIEEYILHRINEIKHNRKLKKNK